MTDQGNFDFCLLVQLTWQTPWRRCKHLHLHKTSHTPKLNNALNIVNPSLDPNSPTLVTFRPLPLPLSPNTQTHAANDPLQKKTRCYSAHEATLLSTTLPRDIIIETLLSVLVLCLGIVLSNARELRAVSWAVWSGEMEREKGAGPYGFLEERVGFLDIRVGLTYFLL